MAQVCPYCRTPIVTETQVKLLKMLFGHYPGSLQVTELSSYTKISNETALAAVKSLAKLKLVKLSLIQRVPDCRRTTIVELTDKGLQVAGMVSEELK